MPAVRIATTSQEDGQVPGFVRISVTEVATEDDGRIVQQTFIEFSRPFHLLQQAAEAADDARIDLPKLPDLVGSCP